MAIKKSEKYNSRLGFNKEKPYYWIKCQKKYSIYKTITIIYNTINKEIHDLGNNKEHYQFYLKKKNTKLIKQLEIFESKNYETISC